MKACSWGALAPTGSSAAAAGAQKAKMSKKGENRCHTTSLAYSCFGRARPGFMAPLCGERSVLSLGQRMVTNSSAAVGWIATVASKSDFLAPIFIATAKP